MAIKYLDKDGLLYFWQKIVNKFVQKDGSKVLSTNDFTNAYKTKLDGIETGATKTTIDATLDSTSTNPVQNKVINSALSGKVDAVSGKGLSTNDYTTAEKTKLSGIETGANKTVIDSALDSSSTNPVQNKVINSALGGKVDAVSGKGLSTNDYTTAEKNKLSGIASGAQVNVIESVEVNGVTATISGKKASVTVEAGDIKTISVNGTKQTIDAQKNVDITVPTNNNQLTNGAGYQNASQVSNAIDSKLGATYKAKGSIAFANLPALSSTNQGNVYNVTDAFTTTANFVEGAGNKYPAGTNVVIINTTGTTYKYDVLSGFVDLSSYVQTSDLVAITNAEIDTIVAS